jgi:hypothetical protein
MALWAGKPPSLQAIWVVTKNGRAYQTALMCRPAHLPADLLAPAQDRSSVMTLPDRQFWPTLNQLRTALRTHLA